VASVGVLLILRFVGVMEVREDVGVLESVGVVWEVCGCGAVMF